METRQSSRLSLFRYVFPILLLVSFPCAVDPATSANASANGSAYSFGSWTVPPVAVTLACVPGGSDCANVSYCLDTANTCDPTGNGTVYSGQVSISTEGVSYIRYASSNSTGSWGDVASGTVEIDATAPSIAISDDASGSWTNNDTISVSVSDSGSGVANTAWVARSDATCDSSIDSSLDAGTNSTSMSADNDSLYLGKYICFRATDAMGKKSYVASNKISYLDTTSPVVNAGADQKANVQFTQNGAASDSGSGISSYSWSQTAGPGTITFGSPSAQGTTINASADGTYVITLTARDSAGNAGTGSFTLNWLTTAPGITVSNPGTSPAQSKMISASVASGTLSMAVTNGTGCDPSLPFVPYATLIFSSESDNGKKVCYEVKDQLGNTAYQISDAVSGIDTTKPVISLNGNSVVTLEVRSNYTDAGAKATDAHDGDITSGISAGGIVNKDKVGTYTLTYDVSDAAGNKAAQATRTVKVVDTTRPVITLLGNSSVTVEIRSNYTDAGTTATDSYDGDISSKIVVGNPANLNAAGTYNVTYDVSDSSGNKAVQAVRTVTVTDSMQGLLEGIVVAALVVAAVVIAGGVAYFLFLRKKHKGL